jgi:hypothetical protein
LAALRVNATPVYPVSARLTLAPRSEQKCLDLQPKLDCRIIDAARDAFAADVARLFKASSAPDLQLVLSIKRAEISRVAAIQLDLGTQVRVLTPTGEIIDEIDSSGVADVLAMEEESIRRAQFVAADQAVADFERGYASSTKIAVYLVAKQIAPAEAVAVEERSEKNLWIAAGLGAALGGSDDSVAVAPSLRVAGAYRFLFAQAVYSHYTSSFQAVDSSFGSVVLANADLTTNDLGLDAGLALRLTRSLELRAGPGLHLLWGNGTFNSPPHSSTQPSSASFSVASPTLFTSVSSSFISIRHGPRFVLGAEAHVYFLSSVDLPELGRKVPAANVSFGVFLGFELPAAAGSGAAR